LEPPRESRHWLVRIYFDGGSRGNPGLAGSGAEVVFLENTTVAATTSTNRRQSSTPSSPSPIITQVLQERKKIHVSKYLGTNATNNQAEYHGVLAGLQRARNEILQLLSSEDGIRYLWTIDLEVRGDSELIIRQLQGDYKCRHAQLQPLFQQVMECVEDLKRRDDLQLNVTFDHIYREDNSTADGENRACCVLSSTVVHVLFSHVGSFALHYYYYHYHYHYHHQ
jgi:ribonuclease HI